MNGNASATECGIEKYNDAFQMHRERETEFQGGRKSETEIRAATERDR